MESLLQQIGVTSGQVVQLITLAAVLLVGLLALRLFFKLTAALLRVGCLLILLIVAGFFFFSLLSGA
jgi:hypothetical protein